MHLHLMNSDKKVKLCRKGFSYLKKKDMAEGWRLHSAGYAVLQFVQFGRIKTHYMHKLLADLFVPHDDAEPDEKMFVRVKNGNKLDCRVSNLEWTTMKNLRRQQNTSKKYRGVSKDGKRYRAVLYDGGERIYLGVYNTPEAAAEAYDEESYKRFGVTESLNNKERYRKRAEISN